MAHTLSSEAPITDPSLTIEDELQQVQTHYRTCNLCEAMCGLSIKYKGSNIISIKGDPDDPYSEGYMCPKALALKDIHEDSDRIRQPLKKTKEGWEPISWKAAYQLATHQIARIQKEHGKNSVATYFGNPVVHNHGALLMAPLLSKSLGSKNRFSATSLDQLPHMLANLKVFGHQGLFPIPDINNTMHFICIGGNPAVSHGSLMSLPNAKAKLEAIKARGGKVVVIDPRKSETAELATEYYPITPGTDPYLLLAMVHEILHQQWSRLGHLEAISKNLDTLTQLTAPFTPNHVSELTGISSDNIRHIAHSFAHATAGAIYGRMGICTQQFGSINAWLIHVLNILTGNMDQPGGNLFTQPAINLFYLLNKPFQKGHFDARRSAAKKLPEFSGEFPTAALADEILSDSKERIRSLITLSGNPVLSAPNGKKMDSALEKLDFMVSIDFYINETSRHADLILPPISLLERSHYDLIFHHLAIRNTSKYSPPLFLPEPDQQEDWQILLALCKGLSKKSAKKSIRLRALLQLIESIGIDRLLDLYLRVGHYGQLWDLSDRLDTLLSNNIVLKKPYQLLRSLFEQPRQSYSSVAALLDQLLIRNVDHAQGLSIEQLKEHPHGVDLGPLKPSLVKRLLQANHQIDLAPKTYQREVKKIKGHLEAYLAEKEGDKRERTYRLIGRRDLRSNNSWLHNSYRLIKGKPRCVATMNEKDAARHKVKSGDSIRVTSDSGSIDIPVEVTNRIMPGVISIPHGWGHQRTGTRQSIAEKQPGVSANDITDDQFFDELTGVAVFNGLPVSVKKSPAPKKG